MKCDPKNGCKCVLSNWFCGINLCKGKIRWTFHNYQLLDRKKKSGVIKWMNEWMNKQKENDKIWNYRSIFSIKCCGNEDQPPGKMWSCGKWLAIQCEIMSVNEGTCHFNKRKRKRKRKKECHKQERFQQSFSLKGKKKSALPPF